MGQLPQDSSVTYSEKVITLTPSAPANGAAAGAKAASPTGPRKSAKGGFVPEGAYPLDGERTVEKAREHYERCTRESLVKIHQAKFPTESVSRHVKPDLIADILQRITLPTWSKPDLIAEATKYDVKIGARTTKDQLALGIVTQLRARGLINAKARGVAASPSSTASSSSSSSSAATPAAPAVPTPGAVLAPAPAPIASQPSAQAQTTLTRPTPPTAQSLFTTPLELAPAPPTSSSSSPSLSSSPLGSGGRSMVKEERSSKRKEKDSSKEKEKEKRPRKKSKNTDATATPTDDQLGAGRTSQPSFVIDVVSLVDQVKRSGSAPPVATDPANLEPERAMRLQTLDLIELLLNVGATAPNDMAFLAGQLKPHIQREKAALASGTQWVDAHKRTLEKRQLKRNRDKAQRKLEQAQAAMAECNQQLASLRDA